ncbi:hypothetical protein [Porphyromonas levii]|uniref:hypothetical protein n=1 Tax=Porphyromonas levii TaxID=28114 RepID=UPI001B8C18B6|nr:hypothetical protein [Porphyromonas levii]MBR8758734.1 hypothetical protein [Porphyromonas levii]
MIELKGNQQRFFVLIFFNLCLSIGINIDTLCAQDISKQLEVDSIDIKQTRNSKFILIKSKALTELATIKLEIASPTFEHLAIKCTPTRQTFVYQKPNLDFLLQSASSGFLLNSNNSLLHSETKGIHFERPILESLSLTSGGDIGNTSLPLSAFPVVQYDAYLGAKYRFTDKLQTESRIHLGQFLGERYLSPTLSLNYQLNSNWSLMLKGGMYQSQIFNNSYHSAYGTIKAQYSSNGWCLYGKWFTSYANQPYLSLSPSLYHHGYSGFGGGVGYYILGSGNVGVGVDYIYDPMTGKMIPKYYIDLTGAINFGVKKLIELIKELLL